MIILQVNQRFSSVRMLLLYIAIAITLVTAAGQDDEVCPDGTLTFAGAEGALRVIEAWKQAYTAKCPNVDIVTEGGGYAMGAARVCDNHILYGGVELGGMSGPFFQPQATSDDGWSYQCKYSNRETILLRVASEGVSVETNATGTAAECIQTMGGLTIDQLRWIFSKYPESELDHSGWDVKSVPFSDGDDSTHLWSELNENCTATEIAIAGPPKDTAAYNFFVTHVLTSLNEEPRDYFASTDDHELDQFLLTQNGAINFFQMYDLLSDEYIAELRFISPVPIMNDRGVFISPNAMTYDSGEYPLLRKVYLGVHRNEATLTKTVPFLEFGLSMEGSQVLKKAGFWPLREWEKRVMYTRIQSSLGFTLPDITEHCGDEAGRVSIAGSTTVEPVSHAWASLFELGCPVKVELDSGGSTMGVRRICADPEAGDPVDIGNMSRDIKDTEALEREDEYVHDCLVGNQERSSFRLDVAEDATVIAVPINSVGYNCLSLLGGLTKDQLRWMFSNYDDTQLQATGWDPSSLNNSDGNPGTHKWSELDARCEAKEIRLIGGKRGDGPFAAMESFILNDSENGETIAGDNDRPQGYTGADDYDIMVSLMRNPSAVGFLGHKFYAEKQNLFWGAPIMNDAGEFVVPSTETISDETYPIRRYLFMNVLNDEDSLKYTAPLLDFGFSHPELVTASGYVPLRGKTMQDMLARLHRAPYIVDLLEDDENEGFEFSSIVFLGPVVIALLLIVCVTAVIYIRLKGSSKR